VAKRQVELRSSRRGGKRRGAGRKRRSVRRRVPHRRRPVLSRHNPLHVTLRVLDGVGRLRCRKGFGVVRAVMLLVARTRTGFRIIDLSIQGNHLHLVCEADDKEALRAGIAAFKISFARRLNRAFERRGAVFADRYHTEVLTCPRQVRNAVSYVLNNWRKHHEDRHAPTRVDPFSRDTPTRTGPSATPTRSPTQTCSCLAVSQRPGSSPPASCVSAPSVSLRDPPGLRKSIKYQVIR
jgi:putative transposase